MKAHDVQLLCRCPVCVKLGHERAMVKVGPMKTPAHDRCAFEQIGDGIELPGAPSETAEPWAWVSICLIESVVLYSAADWCSPPNVAVILAMPSSS